MDATDDVLSPWAEADPIPLKGIHPRLSDLRARYGDQITISRFAQNGTHDIGSSADEGPRFAEWLEKEVDTVIVAVGD